MISNQKSYLVFVVISKFGNCTCAMWLLIVIICWYNVIIVIICWCNELIMVIICWYNVIIVIIIRFGNSTCGMWSRQTGAVTCVRWKSVFSFFCGNPSFSFLEELFFLCFLVELLFSSFFVELLFVFFGGTRSSSFLVQLLKKTQRTYSCIMWCYISRVTERSRTYSNHSHKGHQTTIYCNTAHLTQQNTSHVRSQITYHKS